MRRLLLASTFTHFHSKLPLIFGDDLKEMNVLFIPTAAYAYENYDWLASEQAPLKDHAKTFTEFDLKGKTQDEVAGAIQGKDLVYVTGGNTYYLLEHVQKSGFGEEVKAFIADGGFYLGGSAGAVLTCPRIDFIADMDDPSQANLSEFNGLGLVDFYVMPHIDHAHYGPKAAKCIEALNKKNETVIGLNDNQALWVQDNFIRTL